MRIAQIRKQLDAERIRLSPQDRQRANVSTEFLAQILRAIVLAEDFSHVARMPATPDLYHVYRTDPAGPTGCRYVMSFERAHEITETLAELGVQVWNGVRRAQVQELAPAMAA